MRDTTTRGTSANRVLPPIGGTHVLGSAVSAVPDDVEQDARARATTATGPTVLRIGLGGELRRRREAAG